MSVFISDPYAIVQTAGETYIGDASDQVYSINPNLIQAGDVVTIVDQGGTNAIELTAGLEITQGVVTSNEMVLYLSNGAIINVRGADTFTFNVGQNQAGGDTVGTEKTFAEFAQDILGVTLPAEGEPFVVGGPSTVNDDGTADLDPEGDTFTLAEALALGEDLPAEYNIVDETGNLFDNGAFAADAAAILDGALAIDVTDDMTVAQYDLIDGLATFDVANLAYSIADTWDNLWPRIGDPVLEKEGLVYEITDPEGAFFGEITVEEEAFIQGADNYVEGYWDYFLDPITMTFDSVADATAYVQEQWDAGEEPEWGAYRINDTIDNLLGVNLNEGLAVNGAGEVNVVGDATVAQIQDFQDFYGWTDPEGVVHTSLNEYSLSDTAANLTNEDNAAIVDGAVSIELSAAVTVAEYNDLAAQLDQEFGYELADTLENLLAAEEGVVAGAEEYSLTDDVASFEGLAVADALTADELALLDGAANRADYTYSFAGTLAELVAAEEGVVDAADEYSLTDDVASYEGLAVADALTAEELAILAGATNEADYTYSLLDTLENLAAAAEGVVDAADEYSLTDATDAFEGLTVENILSQGEADLLNGAANAGDYTYSLEDDADAFFSNGEVKAELVDLLDDPAAITVTTEVTQDQIDALNAINDNVDYAGGQTGESFTLTAGSDDFTGTLGNDTFSAPVVQDGSGTLVETLQSIDFLDGDDGIDTLNATLQGDGSTPSISNIEVLNFRTTTATTIDATAIAGAEQIWSKASVANLTLTNVAEQVTAGLNNSKGDFDIAYADDVLGSTSATQSVVLQGGVGTAATSSDLNITITGASTDVLTDLAIDNSGVSYLTVTQTTTTDTIETVTVTGSGSLELLEGADSLAALAEVAAGDFTGDLTMDLSTPAAAVAVTVVTGSGDDDITTSGNADDISTGAGDDTITLASTDVTVNAGDGDDTVEYTGSINVDGTTNTINGGAGNNTLAVTLDDTQDAFTDSTGVSNFQVLALTATAGGDAISADLDGQDDITSVTMTAVNALDTLTITNAGSQTYTVLGTVALDDLVIGLADDTGDTDEVTVNVASDDDTTATTLDDVEATNVETINLNLTAEQDIEDAVEVNVDEISTTAAAIVISGNADAELGGGVALTNTDINASDAIGDLTINLGAADHEVTGGDGDDTFALGANSNANDTIVGGAGDDTMTMTVATGVTGVVAAADVETVSATVTVQDDASGGATTVTSTVDASNITSADVLEISGTFIDTTTAGDTDTLVAAVTGVTSAVGTVKLNGDFADVGDDSAEVSIALDDATGETDSLDVELYSSDDDATADESLTQTISSLTINDVETLNISTNEGDDSGVTTVSALIADAATTINLTGDAGLIISDGSGADAVETIDLSDFAAGFDLAAFGAGATFKLGSIADGENGNNIDTNQDTTLNDAFSAITLLAGQKDVVEFTNLDNSIVINGVEGGGDISDDDFDFSAMGIAFEDLTFTDGDYNNDAVGSDDVAITSDQFDGTIYMLGVTSTDLNQVDFIFA